MVDGAEIRGFHIECDLSHQGIALGFFRTAADRSPEATGEGYRLATGACKPNETETHECSAADSRARVGLHWARRNALMRG